MTIRTTAGASDANSYATTSQADAVYSDRGNTEWSALVVSQKEIALIKATDYIDAYYTFKSVKSTDTQALQNPRYGEEGIDPAIVKACILLAVHMTVENPNTSQDRPVDVIEEKLDGVASEKKEYSKRSFDPYPLITGILKDVATYHSGSASSMKMVRR